MGDRDRAKGAGGGMRTGHHVPYGAMHGRPTHDSMHDRAAARGHSGTDLVVVPIWISAAVVGVSHSLHVARPRPPTATEHRYAVWPIPLATF